MLIPIDWKPVAYARQFLLLCLLVACDLGLRRLPKTRVLVVVNPSYLGIPNFPAPSSFDKRGLAEVDKGQSDLGEFRIPSMNQRYSMSSHESSQVLNISPHEFTHVLIW